VLFTTLSAPLQAHAAQTTQAAPSRTATTLPARLSDAEFWKLVTDISEPGGVFRMADNFVSNEREIGMIAGTIRANGPNGGVYMGVGPEQNLTYIAAVRPKMVFIVDIRRQAVMHHLLYKAIFELSRDRADFISMLFAKPRPAGIDSTKNILQVWEAIAGVPMDTALAATNLARFRDLLTMTHGCTLTADELDAFDHVYRSFVTYGPLITTNGPPGDNVNGAIRRLAVPSGTAADSLAIAQVREAARIALGLPPGTAFTPRGGPGGGRGNALNFIALTTITDQAGQFNSFLATEESFRFLRNLHVNNLFVPNSGNFGGPRAIRAVGNYVREHGGTVSAFYVSNVEQYLFMDGIASNFYASVATLPVDEKSVFIRPGGTRFTGTGLCPIAAFLRAVADGRVIAYNAASQCVGAQ
jgi:hypothetical protein